MRLRVMVPHATLVDAVDVTRITGESHHGVFTLLPRHIDVAAPLIPGLLSFQAPDGEHTLGVDEGTLVKCGHEVWVSVHDAIPADDPDIVRAQVAAHFGQLDERERRARSALAQLESAFYRHFVEHEVAK